MAGDSKYTLDFGGSLADMSAGVPENGTAAASFDDPLLHMALLNNPSVMGGTSATNAGLSKQEREVNAYQ